MHIIFRFDSGPDIGMGHLMRCLTLAVALESRGARLSFLGYAATVKAIRRYCPQADCHTLPQGMTALQEAKKCRKILEKFDNKPDWLIADHYKLGKTWERQMRGGVRHILAIDDLHRPHDCDLLLDTNLSLTAAPYAGKIPPHSQALLGPRYALLRSGFKKAYAKKLKTAGKTPRIFLCFGGADPHDLTRWAAMALAGVKGKLDIVVGYSYAKKTSLAALCRKHPNWTLFVDHPHPETLMAKATIAVGAGGTMTWERCAMALPTIVISIADNQREGCKTLAAAGIIDYLGDAGDVDAQTLNAAVSRLLADEAARSIMAKAARSLVDGEGAERVATAMEELQAASSFSLRPLRRSDADIILAGRNADHVRSCMLTQHVIAPEEHRSWMEKRLADAKTPYFVFLQGNKPIGLVGLAHFDETSQTGDWGFYLWDQNAPAGAGTRMLAAFLDEMFNRRKLRGLTAQVITANKKSLHLHRKLGFSEDKETGGITDFSLSRADWRKARKPLLAMLANVTMLPL